jgi:regulator of replication initiation timing
MFSNTCAMTLAQKSDRILAQTRGLSGTTPNATQLIEELRSALEENMKELERLRAERDEARRELCRIESSASGDPNMTSRAVAADLGWDCFKEDGK